MIVTTLQKILSQIIELNNYTNKLLIDNKYLEEKKQNLIEFDNLKNQFNQKIKKLHSNLSLDNKNMQKELFDIHVKLFDINWHIDEINELIEKVIGQYRTAIENKDLQDDN